MLLVCATSSLRAQGAAGSSPGEATGPHVSSVSVYGAYYSNGIPDSGGGQSGAPTLPYDVGVGGSIRFDWSRFTERSTFALSYTPSYTADLRYSSLNAFNHAFSLNVSRKLAPRWTFGFALGGSLVTQEQSQFASTALSTVASTAASFSDLASALLSSHTNNPQLGVVLTNAPLLESPVSNLVYGERMLTASAHTSLSYSFSPRLFITFSGNADRSQHISQERSSIGNSYLIPTTTSAGAGIAISYSLSPMTQIGASVNTERISSTLFNSYTSTTQVTWGRALNHRWLMQLHGGVGIASAVNQGALAGVGPITLPAGPRPVFGASLTYKMPAHTFLGSFDRTTVDSYGLGATTTSASTATWRWRAPGRPWWLETAFTWQQMRGDALVPTSGWRATAGLNRALGAHVVLLTQYIYMDYSGGFQRATSHFAESTARVALTWTPHPVSPQ